MKLWQGEQRYLGRQTAADVAEGRRPEEALQAAKQPQGFLAEVQVDTPPARVEFGNIA